MASFPTSKSKLAETEAQPARRLVDEAVTPDDIAQVVSRWTGVPVDKMLEGERDKLLQDGGQARPSASSASTRR